MINRKILCAGMPRSGTKSLYGFFKTMGIRPCLYQPRPRVIEDESRYAEYDIFDPPDNVKIVLEARKALLDSVESYIEIDWASSMIMYALSQICPEVRFLILIRDPYDCCNSLLRFRKDRTLDAHIFAWQAIYSFICRQVENMQHKPFFIDLGKYAKGEYCELLLRLFGLCVLDTEREDWDKLAKLTAHVKQKINSQNEYEKMNLPEAEYEKCMAIWQRLEAVCEDSWITEEGLI